jgi:NAD(P)-dependent dehydrogenase (short-subunit alcohol dehydrogenase family)
VLGCVLSARVDEWTAPVPGRGEPLGQQLEDTEDSLSGGAPSDRQHLRDHRLPAAAAPAKVCADQFVLGAVGGVQRGAGDVGLLEDPVDANGADPLLVEQPVGGLEQPLAGGRAVEWCFALELAREGAEVIVSGRDAARGAETVATTQAQGGTARFIAADLGDLESVAALAREAADADVLVNNAGAFGFAPTVEQDVQSFQTMFDVNVRGTFFLTAALAPKMAARGGGSIVNITTMAAEFGMVGAAAYGASKAALVGLTRAWAAEFGADNIRVNAVSPGPTTTGGTTAVMGPDAIPQLGATVPLNRSATADEIARVVAFAASSSASYVTGAIIAADGDRTAV